MSITLVAQSKLIQEKIHLNILLKQDSKLTLISMQSPGSLDIIPARSCPSEKRSLNEKGLLSSGGGFSTDWSQAAPQDTESNAKVQCFPGISVVKNQPASARGHGFNPWSGKISQAAEQLSPCSTTIERELQSLGTSSTEPRLQLLKPVCP